MKAELYLKIGKAVLLVKSDSQIEESLVVARTFFEARQALIDRFDVNLMELEQTLGEDDAQLPSKSENPIQHLQVQNTESKDTSLNPGTNVGTLNNNAIYDNVINRMKEKFNDNTFISREVIKILKDFWPNTSDATLLNLARLYIRYLKENNMIEVVGKQGKAQLCQFRTNQDEEND
jgi:hypothetical protein